MSVSDAADTLRRKFGDEPWFQNVVVTKQKLVVYVRMVINIGALKSGDFQLVERDIEAVTQPCRDCGTVSKVIIEAAFLTDAEKVTACTLAKAAGADFVKTSTGFGPGGATVADVTLMRQVVGQDVGVKAAGGVRDLESLKAMCCTPFT